LDDLIADAHVDPAANAALDVVALQIAEDLEDLLLKGHPQVEALDPLVDAFASPFKSKSPWGEKLAAFPKWQMLCEQISFDAVELWVADQPMVESFSHAGQPGQTVYVSSPQKPAEPFDLAVIGHSVQAWIEAYVMSDQSVFALWVLDGAYPPTPLYVQPLLIAPTDPLKFKCGSMTFSILGGIIELERKNWIEATTKLNKPTGWDAVVGVGKPADNATKIAINAEAIPVVYGKQSLGGLPLLGEGLGEYILPAGDAEQMHKALKKYLDPKK
jgi:hypothetical protein